MNYQNLPQQHFYTPAQVAELLHVKTSTVHAWLSRSEMRANKIGHRRFITPEQIKDFYSRRRTGEYVDYTYAKGPVK